MGGQGSEGQSPSSAFAEITIDSGSSSVDMSGSENGGNNSTEQPRAVTSPGRVLGARSASPAKRSAADMEDAGSESNAAGQQSVPGSFEAVPVDEKTPFDDGTEKMKDVQQETIGNGASTSEQGTMTTSTSSTGLQSDDTRPPAGSRDSKRPVYTTEETDQQVAKVRQAWSEPLDLGQRGVVVSTKWLARVLSRSSEGLKSGEYPKDAREGSVGPVDNADIVPEGGNAGPFLHDMEGRDFIPLKPGLTMGCDYEVMSNNMWGDVVASYGYVPGQHQVERYAKDTAPPGSIQQNIMYDVYPPTFTIRKVPQPNQQTERPSSGNSVNELRRRQEGKTRGQIMADDAPRLVSARSEHFQSFLRRAKEAAEIPQSSKVKVWRLLDPAKVANDGEMERTTGVPSPPQSRSNSPVKPVCVNGAKLVLAPADFKAMEIGKELEPLDVVDETNNDKYNGKSNMDTFGLFHDQILLLEEQIGGPGGGEYSSDSKKKSAKFSLKLPGKGSKPNSAPTSGRTSPTPGGMMTRGRARRDGRTRGTVGLTNLGNTCYMNSALQCIRSVEELARYFLSGSYKPEINTQNPLGHGGAMAKQYALLLQNMYGDNAGGSVSPSNFKKTLGGIQPLFSGYQQQDSQEFLSFLVDALHEDLNRIMKKPYNENPDSDDKTVHDPQAIIELGEIYRKNHKARNDSVAMDLFSGFYKNTMECPKCDKISITFDPYSLLTVQLPIENTFQHTIAFVPLNGKPVNHAVDIDKNATISMLKQTIAEKHPGVMAENLWMAEVYSHKIYKVFTEDNQSIAEAGIQGHDYIFMFELEKKPTNVPEVPKTKLRFSTYSTYSNDRDIPGMDSDKGDCMAVPVFMRQKNRFGQAWDITMHPLYVTITREEAEDYDTILKKVLVAVSGQTSRQILKEFDEDTGPHVNGAAATERDAEKAESSAEDAAQVSDRSVPSEDGYIEVSLGQHGQNSNTNSMSVDGDAKTDTKSHDTRIPPRFMDPQYFLSPALRTQLFNLNYAKSADGLNCASMSSINDKTVESMFDRVKRVRRSSVQSSSSEQSTTSTGSTTQLTAETEDSDVDGSQPDIKLGNEQPMPWSAAPVVDSDDESEMLPDNPLDQSFQRGGRRVRGKADKFAKSGRKHKTYSKKERRQMNRERNHQNRPNSRGSLQNGKPQRQFNSKLTQDDDENPYYIKLGEAIVLDWLPEGLDALFNGDASDDGEMRGHWTSRPDGKGLDMMPDPVLEEKKAKRLARKKHGITLEDCFVETGKREILSEDNAWYCGRCKEMRQAAKTLEIWTIPDILIVHLKRFGGNRSFRDKIDVNVEYPVEGLEMTHKVGLKEDGKEYVYDLFAVDNHYGGLGGGHYTAMAKNFYDGQWYDYNGKTLHPLCACETTANTACP